MNIPIRHLSVRVPWHDSGWNGKVCCKPRENGSCMFLPRINESKDSDMEEQVAESWMHELGRDKLPPCVSEKVHFMSPHGIYKKINHPYSKGGNNSKFYGHYKETTYCYPGYSFSVIPYNWMLKNPKDNTSDKAVSFQILYDIAKEPALNFENSWVQQVDNQRALLDTFIKPIKANQSLVFVYAKNVPFVESSSRILIGVGHISEVGQLTEYEYDDKLPTVFRSCLWERPIFHTIREEFENGFLLPYQELLSLAEKKSDVNINDFVAFAPNIEEFSFGSEWVSNDTAIESLLILHEKLRKLGELLPAKNYDQQLKWLDKELSRLWKMRGPFPGLGSVLSGLKIPNGNLIAWELDNLIRDEDKNEVIKNPWDFVEEMFKGNTSFLSRGLEVKISNTQKSTWNKFSEHEKDFLRLLSRMNLDNDQVSAVIDSKTKEKIEFLKNPYLLFEESRLRSLEINVTTVDKALFGDPKILKRFPLSDLTDIADGLDQRRIRAFGVDILEKSAREGHTLLTDSQFVSKLDEQPVQPLCNPSLKNIIAIEEFFQSEIAKHVLDADDETYYFKLQRLEIVKDKIKNFVQKRIRRSISPAIKQNWLELIENNFGKIDLTKPMWFQDRDTIARNEKAMALDTLSNNRISVLIGPAGTGKTTLLNIFCSQPFISSGTILRIAPTGKARVKMGKEAKTLAQFLINGRYDPETGQYYINDEAPIQKYDTVIVDEASMLTEEQLAALLDSLTGVERFILVGDYRQLPPIGAGRPFVDIIEYLRHEGKGIAELKILFRQFSQDIIHEQSERIDVRLSKWFSDDNIKKREVDIFNEIAGDVKKDWKHIKFIEWHNVRHLEEVLVNVMNDEIENLLKGMQGKVLRNPQANFDASLGSNFYIEKSNWSGFGIESAVEIENWQILSPTRTGGYGTKIINQKIQKTFRGKAKEKAIFPGKYTDWKTKQERYAPRKQPRPIGDDGIIYGDKVINTKNTKWDKPWNYMFNPNRIPDTEVLKYMANGEIGLHIGAYGDWTEKKFKRPIYIAFSSQPDYAYSFQERDFQEDGDVQLELAYSITVHKSQGSGFKLVLFVLPNPCPVLSRELFYTALTRQEDRIVILHQGNFKDYQKFTRGEFSETGRRLTDLFREPALKFVNNKIYDTNYIQVSERGEFMISKSEVIIADKLHHYKIQYVYEAAITDSKGITIHPDFTIEDSDSGIIYYWEHLGLLVDDTYRSKWVRKLEWYQRNGIVEYTSNPDSNKQLIITRDKPDGGIDSSEIKSIIEKIFGIN